MNNIFIKFIETKKELIKIFSVKTNKTNFDNLFNFEYWSEDILLSDEEPNLYDNFVSHNHVIKVFDEYEYSDDIVYKKD